MVISNENMILDDGVPLIFEKDTLIGSIQASAAATGWGNHLRQFERESKRRAIFRINVFQMGKQQTLFAMRTCVLGRLGNFANCRTKVRD